MFSPSATMRVLGLAVLSLMLPGCGAMLGEAAGALPRPVIEESLDTLDDPATQRAIADVLSSPEYRDATRELLANVTDGTLDALSDEERRVRLGELTDHFVGTIAESLGDAMRTDLGPAVATMVAQTMDRALTQALSEENRERVALAVSQVAHDAVVSLATAIREDLAPAIRELLANEEVKQALAETTRQIAREIVLGLDDGFREVERRDERGARPETVLSRMQDFANEGVNMLQLGLVVFALLTVILVAWLIHTRVRSHSVLSESNRRELAVMSVLGAVKAAEGKPWAGELRDLLKESFRDNEDADYLREVLRKNRHLRMAEGNGHAGEGGLLDDDHTSPHQDAH